MLQRAGDNTSRSEIWTTLAQGKSCLTTGSHLPWRSDKVWGMVSVFFFLSWILFRCIASWTKTLYLFLCYYVTIVQQFDYHLPTLTVTETLLFHARLRLPRGSDEAAILNRVQEVLKVLGLTHCGHVYVGGEELKGISGGEKRRLSIGIQLLSNPAVCLLDEPTTGLDAFTARHIVSTLRDLAKAKSYRGDDAGMGQVVPLDAEAGVAESMDSLAVVASDAAHQAQGRMECRRTVLLTIHQPRYDIFAEIDDVVLLSRGDLVWSGPVADMLIHFDKLQYPCPSLVNPADFILDLSSIDVSVSLFASIMMMLW